MIREGTLALTAALVLACGAAAANAQSYGNTGPARADTTDPNSAPVGASRERRSESELNAFARGNRRYRTSRKAVRARPVASRPAEAKPDPAIAAQRNTALFLRDAMMPWAAASATPEKKKKK
jgi:hypothetical protein